MRNLDRDDGNAALMLYEAYADRLDCPPKSIFLERAATWTLCYMLIDGVRAGVAASKAGMVHIGVLPAWRRKWATRGFIKSILRWASVDGKVTTGLSPGGGERSVRLIEGVGFKRTKPADEGYFYELLLPQ